VPSVLFNSPRLFADVSAEDVSAERYLNHPTFGMLYRVSPVDETRDLYATLYAQRIFFVVTLQTRGASFEVIPLMDARHLAEQNLARSRREGPDVQARWRQLFDQTFI
jgi:PII interaction protein X